MTRLRRVAKSLLYPFLQAWRTRLRQAELRKQSRCVTRGELVTGLSNLPIAPDAVVLVHSSLKALGFVEGGPQTVVDALIEVFVKQRHATVMVPTYSIQDNMHTTLSQGVPFNVAVTPSNLGTIPECFRKQELSFRSLHPSHSFAAIGSNAKWLLSEHHLAGTNFGRGTPMGKLLETPSYLLGLGSDIGHVTFYHCLEDMEDFPFNVYASDGPFEVQCVDAANSSHKVWLPAHAPGDLQRKRIDFPANAALREFFASTLARNAGLSWHRIGQANCWLVDARAMYSTIKELMKRGITIYSSEAELASFHQAELQK